MNTQKLEHEKLSLITWIAELQDSKLIQKLKEFQTKNNDIPQWQMDEINRISEGIDDGTISTRSWDEAKKEIFKK
jgi:hypothetical protein